MVLIVESQKADELLNIRSSRKGDGLGWLNDNVICVRSGHYY